MVVVDENGNLFGVINVVDALVVALLVAGVVGAGVVLLDSPGPNSLATTHATLDLGEQPESVVTDLERGDTYTTGRQNLTVTDVYVTPSGPDAWRVLVRVEVTGTQTDETVRFDGTTVSPGSELSIVTSDYTVAGVVTATGDASRLDAQTTTVEIRGGVSASEAKRQVSNRTLTVGDHVVARVRNVTHHPFTDPRERRLYYTVELETLRTNGRLSYGGQRLREGTNLRLDQFNPVIDGRLLRVGGGSDVQQKTVVVEQVVPIEAVSEYRVGRGITIAGQRSLKIVDRTLQPVSNPSQVRVYLTLSLQTVAEDGQYRYAAQPTRIDTRLQALDGDFVIDGRIRSVGGSPTVADRTVVLETRLPADRAAAVSAGDAMTFGNASVATVDDAAVYATGTPDERVAYVETTLTALRRSGEFRFGDTPVREGASIDVDTDEYSFRGRIVGVGGGLNRTTTDVLVTDTVSTDTISDIEVGDTVPAGGEAVATVQNVSVYGTASPDRKRVALGLELETVGYGEVPRYGNTTLREGETLALRFGQSRIDGEIRRVGATVPRGTVTDRRVRLRVDDVSRELASVIDAGLVERSHGTVFAELVDVSTAPETVVVAGPNGGVVAGDHPTLREVTLTADLRVRETDTGLRFKRRPLRPGGNVTLDLGTVTVEATVVAV